jgi:hypothetical protein
MIFVQTHADLDEDIRDDWRRTLGADFEVPEIFFVDSRQALAEQQSGLRPGGEMGRLMDLLLNKLGASERLRVRRANVLDLLDTGLARCREILTEKQPKLWELNNTLAVQRQELSRRMAQQLQNELLSSHRLWERRLVAAVVDHWGLSPFSCVLRVYNGFGGLIASSILFRARSSAQLAILGTIQGVRWLEGKHKEQQAESSLQRVSRFGLNDGILQEAEIIISGHVAGAGLQSTLPRHRTLEDLRRRAVDVEDEFVGDASQRVDEIIQDLSRRNSRWWIRSVYEVLLIVYLVFVLFRVGKNFFYDSFLHDQPLLTSDFYLAAGLFLVLWCGVLVIGFTRRLRRGLQSRVQDLMATLVEARLGRGLFPNLETAVREAEDRAEQVNLLLAQTEVLRRDVAGSGTLGGKHIVLRRPVGAGV